MQLITFAVVLLMALECLGGIKPPEPDPYSHLDDVAIEILTRCHGNRMTAIGFAGDTSDYILKSLSSRKLSDVSLVHGEERLIHHPDVNDDRPRKARVSVFVITSYLKNSTSPVRHIAYICWAILNSHLHNHLATYYIIMKSDRGCSESPGVLLKMWRNNVLNVNLICINKKVSLDPHIMTYNPYIGWGPKPWIRVTKYWIGDEKTPWWLYIQLYRNGKKMCARLAFDKTQNLGGYPQIIDHKVSDRRVVKRSSKKPQWLIIPTMNNVFRLAGQTMNLTYKFVPKKRMPKGEVYNPLRRDVLTLFQLGVVSSYPLLSEGTTFMSNYRGHKTQLEKILGVVDKSSQLATCLSLLITVLFFKVVVGQDLIPAFLNVLRVVCNTGFLHIPEFSSSRIFLTCILILILIMQGIFQGDLATLLTTAIPNRNINTLRDIVELGSNIYSRYGNGYFMPKIEGFKGKFIKIGMTEDCFPYLQNDTSGVCFDYVERLMDEALRAEMHISDRIFTTPYLVIRYPIDWPLDNRFEQIYFRIFEADILKPLMVRVHQRSLNEFQYDHIVLANQKVSVMTLKDLAFAFVILGIGLAFATIVFVAEIVISRVSWRFSSGRIRRIN